MDETSAKPLGYCGVTDQVPGVTLQGAFMSQRIERTWPPDAEVLGPAREATVHIVEHLAPGGIETLVLDILATTDDGLVFSLQGERDELLANWPALQPIAPRIEGFRRDGRDPVLILRLARALRQAKAKAVFLHHVGPLLYGGVAARLAGVPRVIFVEHDAWHYADRTERLLTRGFIKLIGARLVAVSQQVADRLRALTSRDDVAVIPPGIDTERFRPRDRFLARQDLGLLASWRIIGSVGRLQPVKGHRFLLAALKELPDDVHVIVVGDGPMRGELQQLSQDLSVAQRAHFLGHRDDLDRILPAFDVFCLPSLSEGLPRTLLEAQACGVPVVATNVGGAPEAVCPVSGLIVPPADTNALVAALRRQLNAGNTSEAPRSFVLERMSLKDTVQKYRQLAEV